MESLPNVPVHFTTEARLRRRISSHVCGALRIRAERALELNSLYLVVIHVLCGHLHAGTTSCSSEAGHSTTEGSTQSNRRRSSPLSSVVSAPGQEVPGKHRSRHFVPNLFVRSNAIAPFTCCFCSSELFSPVLRSVHGRLSSFRSPTSSENLP